MTTRYEVRVAGHLDTYWSAWLGGAAIAHEDDATILLHVAVTDQAALHGSTGSATSAYPPVAARPRSARRHLTPTYRRGLP